MPWAHEAMAWEAEKTAQAMVASEACMLLVLEGEKGLCGRCRRGRVKGELAEDDKTKKGSGPRRESKKKH